MKLRVLIVLLVGVGITSFLSASGSTVVSADRLDHQIEPRTYRGHLETQRAGKTYKYDVEINESDDGRGYGLKRLVHLTPTGEEFEDTTYAGITGHDLDFDGRWDQIFYCAYQKSEGRSESGCNSVTREADGSWRFEACGADQGRVEQFTNGEIGFAILELDQALAEVCTPANVVSMTFQNEEVTDFRPPTR